MTAVVADCRLAFVSSLGVVVALTAGCSNRAHDDGPETAAKADAGAIVGTAKTADGRPITRFGGHVSGTSFKSGGIVAADIDGRDGTYMVNVGPGQFGTRAWTDVDYRGHKYRIDLAPVDGKPVLATQDTTAGAVKDFVWRLDGFRAGTDERSDDRDYAAYGGGLILSGEGYGEAYQADVRQDFTAKPEPALDKNATVELTLAPDGPLIDGSAGKPVVFAVKLGAVTGYMQRVRRGIPIGAYKATAVEIAADGARRPLRVVNYAKFGKGVIAGPAASIDVEFLQHDPPNATLNKVDELSIHVMY